MGIEIQRFVFCFANDFRNDPTSKQQVMMLLSKQNRILWVNSIALRRPSVSAADASRIFGKIKGFFRGLDRVNENLYVFSPLVLPLPASRWARRVNALLLRFYLSYYGRKLGMKNIQLWTFVPSMVELVGKLGEKKLIYYCVDKWSEFSFIDKNSMEDMERRLAQSADLVLATAQHLHQALKRWNPNTHLIRHGVDFDFFSSALDEATVEDCYGASTPAQTGVPLSGGGIANVTGAIVEEGQRTFPLASPPPLRPRAAPPDGRGSRRGRRGRRFHLMGKPFLSSVWGITPSP